MLHPWIIRTCFLVGPTNLMGGHCKMGFSTLKNFTRMIKTTGLPLLPICLSDKLLCKSISRNSKFVLCFGAHSYQLIVSYSTNLQLHQGGVLVSTGLISCFNPCYIHYNFTTNGITSSHIPLVHNSPHPKDIEVIIFVHVPQQPKVNLVLQQVLRRAFLLLVTVIPYPRDN
jgi:hypothetical protein